MIYSDELLVREARAKYYQLNGLPADGGIGDRWARYQIGPLTLTPFPNFAHRVRAISRHDVHHIVNDLDTSALGEGLIAAWELGSGCGQYWISWCMEPQALWWGILMAPLRTWRLFLLGRHSRNYFHQEFAENFWQKKVGVVRAELLPQAVPAATVNDVMALAGCALLGLVLIAAFIPLFLGFTVVAKVAGERKPQ